VPLLVLVKRGVLLSLLVVVDVDLVRQTMKIHALLLLGDKILH
jgi:hypothetical protein